MVFALIVYVLLVLASLVAVLNVYLSFLRYPLYRWRGGSKADYRWVSGAAGIGTMMSVIAVCLLASSGSPIPVVAWMWMILLQFVDTGGILWCLGTMTVMATMQWLSARLLL